MRFNKVAFFAVLIEKLFCANFTGAVIDVAGLAIPVLHNLV
jgi:hypothetical protein